jgi:hypothetical protein
MDVEKIIFFCFFTLIIITVWRIGITLTIFWMLCFIMYRMNQSYTEAVFERRYNNFLYSDEFENLTVVIKNKLLQLFSQ